ncbi:MAG: hypothetical protein IPM71_03640 [Bacteroidota bacterium]|nr:MAG: hypothetical protein IPM71_03640 [Bacteroidota bacterium]
MMFYNVENLFDTIDNPATRDEEFLPEGANQWSSSRYWRKVKSLYQVITAAGDSQPPEIIALCEVEEIIPLYHLTRSTPLSKFQYNIVHHDSPDERGIEVALLVRKDKFKIIYHKAIRIRFPSDSSNHTRDILQVGMLIGADTLHVFVNHWPSRRGGQAQSEPLRLYTAQVLLEAIDSLKKKNSQSKCVITGDFNDEPDNASLQMITEGANLVNLSQDLKKSCKCGTIKYQSHWSMFDQFLVSGSLLGNEGVHTHNYAIRILDNPFLLTTDSVYGGLKLFRTYQGPRYLGGYSDHLPVVLEFYYDAYP